MRPKLGTARRLLEKHLTDECRIERDRAGVYDDVLEMATGQLMKRPLDPEVVYEGPCLVAPTGVGQTVEGAQVVERRGYRVRLPYDSPHFLGGDRLTITTSEDPELTGRQLTIDASSQGASWDHGTTITAVDTEGVRAS